ncbi:MAG TPA: chemotaxis protein CheA [Bryobacteraceae bacterium]|nr:chemotaxis protein CheA [Bryobacteraceae bacterium]
MIDRFKQGFQEEARELLGELESALLELDQKRDDPEVVGRAFRALHTIKGSGAMFGFDDIAAFTHNLETVFDQLRKGELAATKDLINLALAAGDQVKTMLDAADGRGSADPNRSAQILASLDSLTGSMPAPEKLAPVARTGPVATEGAVSTRWLIHFRPGPDVILNGTNPLLLLREIRELGTLRVEIDTSQVPPLDAIDPERCYVAWDLVLDTASGKEAIRDIFIFIEDECEIRIEPAPGDASGAEVAPVPSPVSPAAKTAQASAGFAATGTGVASSIRVSAEKLDQLVNLVGELVTVQARLSEVSARRDDPDIQAISEDIDRLTAELRENSMSIRMLPLRNTFERFRRLVHDLGIELNKQVDLVIEGASTELDKTVIDQLNDPLVHLIRNSMDHGVETPDARRAAGKAATATIRLSAQHSGAQVLIRVSDDGRGLDAAAVRAKAIEQGLIDPAAQLSESALFALIMAPGFSTARKVTDVSGRGVGMDVVRRSVEALRGSIEIASQPGVGLTVTLHLPLTLAIIDGLLVRVGATHFVLPLANSLECVELTRQDVQDAHGNHLASVRGETIPYIRLSEHFVIQRPPPEREQIMVVDTEEGHYGLVVDEVLGNHQTVIKNLGRLFRDVPMVSGATILGNGTVALIVDPHRLVQSVIQLSRESRRSDGRNRRTPSKSGRP